MALGLLWAAGLVATVPTPLGLSPLPHLHPHFSAPLPPVPLVFSIFGDPFELPPFQPPNYTPLPPFLYITLLGKGTCCAGGGSLGALPS